MSRYRFARRSPVAVSIALALYGGVGLAQDSGRSTAGVEEIIVTGSFIRGAEQAALPVAVISADDLEKRGSPTMTEIIKAIPSIQSVMGDANQFTAGYSLGSQTINLRGLGPTRNLVLLNGRRVPPNPAVGVGVDANLMPTAAIGRIEVLKDGAAATYGSDAITGVVNFITKTDLEGIAVDGSYSYIEDSDGEYTANIAYGWKGSSTDLLLTAGYRRRNELMVKDRDWALRPYAENPTGGWTASGNPGTFRAGPPGTGTTIVDPQCQNLGGVFTGAANGLGSSQLPSSVGATGCSTQYTALDNLIEDEDHYQVFAQLTQQLGAAAELRVEGLYSEHTAIEHSSPSYLPTQGPTGFSATGVNSTYTVPLNNPGFVGLLPQLTTAQQTAVQNAGGVTITSWRPFLVGGNPMTGGAKEDVRDFDLYRFVVGVGGDIGETIAWDTSVTYGEASNQAYTPDPYVYRIQQALNGLGGPNCTGTTPGANGCLWLNPFSTAISENVITGQRSSVAASAPNSAELTRWMFGNFGYEIAQSVLAIDSTFSGAMNVELPGGKIAWAVGAQYRENGYTRDPVDDTDPNVRPCPVSIANPAATCAVPTGVLSFNSPLTPYDLTQEVKSVYGELRLPILDSLNAQVAVRHEDYGGGIGDTTNPKLALHWQPLAALAFRGSVGTTFRAPPGTQTIPGLNFTSNVFVAQAGRYLAFDNYGNENLEPETATTFSVGTIVTAGGFSGSLDFWSIALEDAIVVESGNDMISRFFAAGANGCTNPAFAQLRTRFTFNSGSCGALADLGRVKVSSSNAQTFDLSGLDVDLRYAFDNVLGGQIVLGLEGTYNLKYEIGATVVEGVVMQPAGDFIGTRGSIGNALPEWRGSAFVEFSAGKHNIRWTARHTDEMFDIRTVPNATTLARSTFTQFTRGMPGSTVEAYTVHDLNYRVFLPWDTTLTASVNNVLDEDPSFARLDLSYDPFMGSPIGRVFKVGFSKTFN